MKKQIKMRVLSFMLTVVMLLGIMPLSAFAIDGKAPEDMTVNPSNNYLRIDSANQVLKTEADFAIGRMGTYEFTLSFKYSPADLPREYRGRATAVFTVPSGFTVEPGAIPNLPEATFNMTKVNGVTTITCKANSETTSAIIGMITINQNAQTQLNELPATNGIYDFTMQIFIDYGTANQVEVHPNNNAAGPVALIEFRADMTQASWTINNVTDSYEWRPGDISAMSNSGVGYGRALIGTTNTIASASNDATHYMGTYFYSSYYPRKGFKVEFTKTAGYLRDGTIFNLIFPEEGNLFLRDKVAVTVTFVTDDGITKSITTNNTSVVGAIINGATLVGNKAYVVAGQDADGNNISWAELLYKAGTFTVECSPKVYYNRLYQGDWNQTTYVAQEGSTVSYNTLNGNPITVTGNPLKFKFVQGGENISLSTPDRDLWTGTSTLAKIAQYKKAGGNYNDSALLTARLNFTHNEDFKIMDNLMLSYDYGEELNPVELQGLRTDADHGFTYRIFITDAATGNLSRVETLVDKEGFAGYAADIYAGVTETVIDGSQVSVWTLAEADAQNNTLYVSRIEVCKKEYEFNEVGAGKGTNSTDTSWFRYRLRAYHNRLSDKTDIPDKFNATVKRTVTSDQIAAQNGQGGPFEKEYTVQTLHLKDNLRVVPKYPMLSMEVNDHDVTGLYRKIAVQKYSNTMLYNVDEEGQYIPFGSDDYDPVVIELSGDAVTMIDRLDRNNMRLLALVGNDGNYYKLTDGNINPEDYLVDGTYRYEPQKETVINSTSHDDNNSDLFSGQLYKIDELCNALGLRYAEKLIVALDDVNNWNVPNDQTEVSMGVYINKVMPGHMNYDGLIGTSKSADLPAGPHNLNAALYCQYSDYESEIVDGNAANDSNGGTTHGTKGKQTYECAKFIEGAMPTSIEVVDYDYYVNPFSAVSNIIGNVIGGSDGTTLPESERTCNTVAQEGKPSTGKSELIELTRVKIPYPTTTQMQYKDGVIDFAGTDPRLLSLANTISFDKNGWRQKWDFTLEYTLSNGEERSLTTSAIQQWTHPISDEPRSHFIIPGVDIANNIYLTSLKVILPNDKNWGTNAAKWWGYGSENPAIPNVGLGMYNVNIPSVYPGTTDKVGSLKNDIEQDDTYDKLKVQASLSFKNIYGESKTDGNDAFKCEGYSNRIAVQKIDIHKLIAKNSKLTNTVVYQGGKFHFVTDINWNTTERTKNLLINNDVRVRPTYYIKIHPNFIYASGENDSFSTFNQEDMVVAFFPAGVGEGKSGTNAYGILKVSYSDKAFADLLSANKGAQNYNSGWNYNKIKFKLQANINALPGQSSPVLGIWMDTEYDANRDGTTPNESGIIVETTNDNNQLRSDAPVGETFGNINKAKYAADGLNAQMLYVDTSNFTLRVNKQALQGVSPYAVANYPYNESLESVTSRDIGRYDNIFSERVYISGSNTAVTKDWEVYLPIMKKGEQYKYIYSNAEHLTAVNDFSVDFMDVDISDLSDNTLDCKVYYTTDVNPASEAYPGAKAAEWKLFKSSGALDPSDVMESLPNDLSKVTMIKVYVNQISNDAKVHFDLKLKLHERKSKIGKETSQNSFYANFRLGEDLYFGNTGLSGKPLSYNLEDMTITGFVWNESDYNSTYDSSVDTKQRDIEMLLFDKKGNRVAQKNNGDFAHNTKYFTDYYGKYTLYAPNDGDWDVMITLPAGKGLVIPNANGNEAVDSVFDRTTKIAKFSFEADPVKKIYAKKNVNAGIYTVPTLTLSTENVFVHVTDTIVGGISSNVENGAPDTIVEYALKTGAPADIASINDNENGTADFNGSKTGVTKGTASVDDGYGGVLTKDFDITVYGNVNYDKNGGVGIVTDSQRYYPSVDQDGSDANTDLVTVKSGSGLSKLGYSFAGWNTKADGTGTLYNANDTFKTDALLSDITLYAQWNINNYNLTYQYGNNVPDAPTLPVGSANDYHAEVTVAEAPTLTGYTFSGWSVKTPEGTAIADGKLIMPAGDVVLEGSWTAHTYTIVFDKNTVDSNGNALVETPEGFTPDKAMTYDQADTLTTNGYSLTGYTFGGWIDENGTTYTNEQEVRNLTAENGATVTLKAIWNIQRFNVSYEYGNEVTDAPALPEGSANDYNSEVTVAEAPTLTGYTFSGWSVKTPEGTAIADGKFVMPASDVVLVGSWTAHTYTIVFDKNTVDSNGNALVETPEGFTPDKAMTYDQADTLTTNGYSLTGYTFGGWIDENGTTYTNEQEVRNLTAENGATVTLKAIWNIQRFNVSYEYGNEVPDAPALPEGSANDYNSEVTVAEAPTLTGYTFSGWSVKTPEGTAIADGKLIMPAGDVVLEGSWTAHTYTIVFDKNTVDSNGNALVGTPEGSTPDKAMTYNQADTLTTNGYLLTGYTFGGWIDENGTAYTNEQEVRNLTTENGATVTLKAIWNIQRFNVSYEYVNEVPDAPTLPVGSANDYNSEVTVAEAPTLTGYTFSGWSVKTPEGTAIADGKLIMPASDVVLEGSWTAHTYTIVFDKNTVDSNGNALVGTPEGSTPDKAMTYDQADTLTTNGYSLTGYTFGGWSDENGTVYADEQEVNNLTSENGATVTLKAIWNIQRFNVSYEYVNEVPGAPTLPVGSANDYNSEVTVAEAPTLTGYTFSGWSVKTPEGTAIADGKLIMPAGDVVLEGSWTAHTYTIVFDKNTVDSNGNALVVTPEGSTPDKAMTYDQADTLTTNGYSLTGYTFGGWSDENGTVYADEQEVNNLTSENGATVTLKAIWNIQRFNVSYEYGNEVPGAPTLPVGSANDYNSEVTVAEAPTLTGYTFSGWSVKTPEGTAIADGKFVMPASDVVLEGSWTAHTYTVIYDKNSDEATGTTASSTHTYGTESKLTANGYTNPGFVFAGWSLTPDDDTVVYEDEAMVNNLTPDDNGEVTLYAVWTACTPGTADPPVQKEITGHEDPTPETFTFKLEAESNTISLDAMPMPATANGEQSMEAEIVGAGSLEFGTITFTKPGTYVYKITELDNGLTGYTYDKSVYTVEYVVTQNGDTLEVVRTITKDGSPADRVVFTNNYEPTSVKGTKISVGKILIGDKPTTSENFIFILKAEDENNPMPTSGNEISINGAGKAAFGEIEFTKAGTYVYTLTEKNTGIRNYKYDTSVYTVTYIVTDKNGVLEVNYAIAKDGSKLDKVEFTNQYESPVTPQTDPTDSVLPESPKTGDSSNILLWLVLLILSTIGLIVTVLYGKRKRLVP